MDDVRMIDANAAKKKLGFAIEPFIGSAADEIRNDALLKAIDIVDSMPTVDVQKMMHDNDLYDKMQDEIKELRRLLRLAVDDLGKFAAIDECVFPFCDERCPFYTYTDCSEAKQWQHHDEAWCILNDGRENDGLN